MNRKQLAVLLGAIFLSIVVFGALQFFQSQKYQETAGKAVYHLFNNEYYQLVRLERYVQDGAGAEAKAQMDMLTALVFYEVEPGGRMPWADLYYSIDNNLSAAFPQPGLAGSDAVEREAARNRALSDIQALLALQDKVRELCGKSQDGGADSQVQGKAEYRNYLDLVQTGSALRDRAEKLVLQSFGPLANPTD